MATRQEILEMLSAGQISVDEATELLNTPASDAIAVQEPAPAPAPAPMPAPAPKSGNGGPRWLRIQVSELDSGRNRVRVNVPLGLVNFGLRVGARFTDEVDNDMLRDVMEALKGGDVTGTLVEVEDAEDNERVHIFVE